MNTDGWTQEALSNTVEQWIVGSTPPRTNPACFVREGGYPWAKAEDVKGGTLTRTAERLSEEGRSQMKLIRPGAVLLTVAGTIGNAAIAGEPMYCNQAVQALYFRQDKILPQFGYYYLLYRRPTLLRLSKAAVIPYVPKKKLQNMKVQYPPIPVQQEIAAHMRLAESLREQAAKLRELPGEFLRALTMRDAEHPLAHVRLSNLLEGSPQSGLRAKASPNGKGISLVSGFDRPGGRLTSLEGCPRVQASEGQIERYGLRPGDLLLRAGENGEGAQGVLVGSLPEPALVGGNLIRFRPHIQSQFSPVWLLAWLTGPGGVRLFADGKLQRRALDQCRVPLVRDPQGFERIFSICEELAEKTAQFSDRAQALFDAALHRLFAGGPEESIFYEAGPDDGLDADFSSLIQPMRDFLGQMSQFQQKLYRTLLKAGEGQPQPVHALLKQMRTGSRGRAEGIQDALSAMALLQQFGLAERAPQRIPARSDGLDFTQDVPYITDHNKQPIYIDAYKPVEEIFEEIAYAAGAGKNSEL